MPNFQITDVTKKKSGDPGTWVAYGVTLAPPDEDAPQIEAEITQSQNAPAPRVGERGEFTLEETRWGLKAKRPRSGNSRGGFKGTDPKDAARMGRAHAQEMALRFVALRGPIQGDRATLLQAIRPIIDWFEKDVDAAQPAPAAAPLPGKPSDVPAPPPPPQPAAVGSDDDIPF